MDQTYTIQVSIAIRNTGHRREPVIKVLAKNSVEAFTLAIMRAQVSFDMGESILFVNRLERAEQRMPYAGTGD